jgi:hypothetical protein
MAGCLRAVGRPRTPIGTLSCAGPVLNCVLPGKPTGLLGWSQGLRCMFACAYKHSRKCPDFPLKLKEGILCAYPALTASRQFGGRSPTH